MRKTGAVLLVAVLALAGVAGLKLQIDRLPHGKLPGSSIIYIPSGKYLKAASFGFSSLMADILFVWTIQYYGNPAIPNKFEYFIHIFSILAELDPRWTDTYEVGALIAFNDTKRLDLALRILDLGAEKNPGQWLFPFEAGHYALSVGRAMAKAGEGQKASELRALAKDYFRKASEIPGAPAVARRLYADAAFLTGDFETAWATWREVYRTATDPAIKKIASNHLYRVKAEADIERLNKALAAYRGRYGHPPRDLGQLVAAGFISSVPKDFDDKDYLYDPAKAEVKTRVSYWKR